MIAVAAAGAGLLAACGNLPLFNPSFVNTFVGGQFPATPGPRASFILVRVVNETANLPADFIVTAERQALTLDDDGQPQFDDNGNPITQNSFETVRLRTFPVNLANELGHLFPCSEESGPVIRIGLGRDLVPGEAGAFVGFGIDDNGIITGGVGVPSTGVFPLELAVGNFNCGDTIIYRLVTSVGSVGNVQILPPLLLPGSEQPDVFSGPNTFVTYENFLETQISEIDQP